MRFSQELSLMLAATGAQKDIRGSLMVRDDFAAPGLGLLYGVETSKEETEVTVLMQTLIPGLGWNY